MKVPIRVAEEEAALHLPTAKREAKAAKTANKPTAGKAKSQAVRNGDIPQPAAPKAKMNGNSSLKMPNPTSAKKDGQEESLKRAKYKRTGKTADGLTKGFK